MDWPRVVGGSTGRGWWSGPWPVMTAIRLRGALPTFGGLTACVVERTIPQRRYLEVKRSVWCCWMTSLNYKLDVRARYPANVKRSVRCCRNARLARYYKLDVQKEGSRAKVKRSVRRREKRYPRPKWKKAWGCIDGTEERSKARVKRSVWRCRNRRLAGEHELDAQSWTSWCASQP